MEDYLGGEIRGEEVAREEKVRVEFEARFGEDDGDGAIFLALLLGCFEDLVGCWEVVD